MKLAVLLLMFTSCGPDVRYPDARTTGEPCEVLDRSYCDTSIGWYKRCMCDTADDRQYPFCALTWWKTERCTVLK